MNQQSDSADLLGGYKPVVLQQIISPVLATFEALFSQTFSQKQNQKFLGKLVCGSVCTLCKAVYSMQGVADGTATSPFSSRLIDAVARPTWLRSCLLFLKMDYYNGSELE